MRDGTFVSMEKSADFVSGMSLYHAYYVSHGMKVEAYIVAPQEHDKKYPLMVICHGGYVLSYAVHDNDSTHGVSLRDIPVDLPPTAVYVYPQYRGYMGSEGTIPDILGVEEDIQNAISAAQSLSYVEPHKVYLIGASLGGGAVLGVAEHRSDVKSVVAISPFVGFDTEIKWFYKLGRPSTYATLDYPILNRLGPNPDSNTYRLLSPDAQTSSISAPVLFIQGTKDNHVIWQSVQECYEKMKNQHKTVRLVLIPGGDHYLLFAQNPNKVRQEINTWVKKYGFPNNVF
jgi:dipeptidyl aminopeptidase/acylaminoacyl peptidase